MSTAAVGRETIVAPTRMRRHIRPGRLALAGAALLVAAGGAWYGAHWWTDGRFLESTDDAYVGGNVTAIAPHVGGFVAAVVAGDNAFVHAGQVLIRLDDRDFRAAAAHAEAIVRQRQARLGSLRAQDALQQSLVAEAQADLTARTAGAAFAQQDAARYRALAQSTAGTRQDAQRSAALDAQAGAEARAASARLDAARRKLAVLATDIAEGAAAVEAAEADLQTARLNLGYTEIRAPLDGYVGDRGAQVGAYVTAGTALLSLVPAHGLWVDANLKEDQLAAVTPGQPARVVADVLPGTTFRGHVLSLAPATGAVFSVIPAENATGNFTKIVQRVPVRIALDDGDATLGRIRPGLSVTATIDTRAK